MSDDDDEDETTALLALFGDPVDHSLSPVMQNGWLEDHGIEGYYAPYKIPVSDAAKAFRALRGMELTGANVTVPHKELAARSVDRLDGVGRALGAINTIRWEDDGTVSGFNTDAPGLIAALDESSVGWRAQTGTAVVLGAGGAGRAAAWALSHAGVSRVLIANRTAERAQQVAALTPRGLPFPWAKLPDLFASADLIVNTTTLGMSHAPEMDWPIDRAPSYGIVMDAVYAPLETPLLAAARARGMKTVDGLGMLIHQGALAFAHWFGVRPDTGVARERLLDAIAERQAGP
jgi:shikimate dehydrogenase